MAMFKTGMIPSGIPFDNAVAAVRAVLAANKHISDEVDRQVAQAAPHDRTTWETERGKAVKQAMLDNLLFRQEINAKVPNTI